MDSSIEQVIMKSCDLPTMPAVAGRVVQLVSNPDATAGQLNKAIMSDQALAARLLKLANSSFYGCLRSINTVTQAIVIIGFSSTKNIVLAASTKDVNKKFGLTEKILHEHSLGVATASHVIAKEIGFKNAEEAFMVGLLHDIGKVVLNNSHPDKFREAIQEVYNQRETSSEVETAIFGFNHAEVGAMVLKKWNFSPEIVNAVINHHSIENVEKGDLYLHRLTLIAATANAFCHKIGIGVREPEDVNLKSLLPVSMLKLPPDRLTVIEENILQANKESQSILA